MVPEGRAASFAIVVLRCFLFARCRPPSSSPLWSSCRENHDDDEDDDGGKLTWGDEGQALGLEEGRLRRRPPRSDRRDDDDNNSDFNGGDSRWRHNNQLKVEVEETAAAGMTATMAMATQQST